jgi:hypothetical protein
VAAELQELLSIDDGFSEENAAQAKFPARIKPRKVLMVSCRLDALGATHLSDFWDNS